MNPGNEKRQRDIKAHRERRRALLLFSRLCVQKHISAAELLVDWKKVQYNSHQIDLSLTASFVCRRSKNQRERTAISEE